MFHKPLPYTLLQDDNLSKQYAGWLRETFTPLLKKRMPTVYYSGFSHRFIPEYITKYKKQYPYFIRTDIAKFYPSIPHKELIVATQLAYKKLIGLDYVPRRFKQDFLPKAQAFLSRLPLEGIGLPLNSSVSKSWATLIYIPLLLDLKKKFDIKFISFVDDFIIMCRTQNEAEQVYAFLFNGLQKLGLHIASHKVSSGRFSAMAVDFCGWHFSGGYIGICDTKISAFKEKIKQCISNFKHKTLPILIKKVNHKILGFGHYYKYGQVKKVYETLDIYITKTIKIEYLRHKIQIINGAYKKFLYKNGLKSLVALLPKTEKIRSKHSTINAPLKKQKPIPPETEYLTHLLLEKLLEQNKQIIALLKSIRKKMDYDNMIFSI